MHLQLFTEIAKTQASFTSVVMFHQDTTSLKRAKLLAGTPLVIVPLIQNILESQIQNQVL
jgi:hypothetical protein